MSRPDDDGPPPADRTIPHRTGGSVPAAGPAAGPLPSVPGVTLQRELARGGMGVVYVGRQEFLDRTVAVKLLSMELQNEQFTARFQREAKLLAGIKHPNIVACHDAGVTDDGLYYLVMEFVDGPNLKNWVANNGPFPVPAALEMTKAVAKALAHAHELGVIHRDVKPENILLETATSTRIGMESPFLPKLVDLGLARMQSERAGLGLTSPGAVMGTPTTMSPEQFDDPDSVDFRTDVYGLGCAFYEMLTGSQAFRSTKLTDLVVTKRAPTGPNPCDELEWLSPRVGELVARMLAADREDRPASYEQLCREIDELIQDWSSAGTPLPTGPEPVRAPTPPRNPLSFDTMPPREPEPASTANATQGILRSTELNFLAREFGGGEADGGGAQSDSPFVESTATPTPSGTTATAKTGATGNGRRGPLLAAGLAIAAAVVVGAIWLSQRGEVTPKIDPAETGKGGDGGEVAAANPPPAANAAPVVGGITGPQVVEVDRDYAFEVAATDTDGDELTYRWSAASPLVLFSPSDRAQTSVLVRDGLEGVVFPITATVRDARGAERSVSRDLTVGRVQPRSLLSDFNTAVWSNPDKLIWSPVLDGDGISGKALGGAEIRASRRLPGERYWSVVGLVEPARLSPQYGVAGVEVAIGARAWSVTCRRTGDAGRDWSLELAERVADGSWRAVADAEGRPTAVQWTDEDDSCQGGVVVVSRRTGSLEIQIGCQERGEFRRQEVDLGNAGLEAELTFFVKSDRGVFREFALF
ncbi:MAG: serine/threonine protein kinase [Planctomycetes bacterium]|nr:serine/threonine protein kinase [Planctomycetota bacterium]